MLLKLKNFVVRIWPLSLLQKKVNLLSDELIIKNQYVLQLNERNAELVKKIDNLEELYNHAIFEVNQEKIISNELRKELIIKTEQLKEYDKKVNLLSQQLEIVEVNKVNIKSGEFWDSLYRNNGNSGTGSYDRLAEFKADVVNKFIQENNIQKAIEFGCGDGNQLSLINYNYYVGVDVSSYIIEQHRKKYEYNEKRKFYCTLTERDKYIHNRYDLSISMDVIFHLLEQEVFSNYMQDLFSVSDKYVIIYSSNHEEYTKWPEFRHRNFIGYIQNHIKGWNLIEFIPNKYPYIIGQEENTSTADFYIFQKNS